MSQIRVHNFAFSLEGSSTGEGQSLEQPFGHARTRRVEGFDDTLTFRQGLTWRSRLEAETWPSAIH